ncbi:MAG TPA: NAD-dependent epimerase/dehydratase family protein, partial [Chitinophagales bacterium]|nr:NAD-dependent epimerase/dehydratase family protein [Chitinophagales bacterium]
MMKKILITGGSGLIGSRLTQLLHQNNFEVAWLSRGKKATSGVKLFHWDIEKQKIDIAAVLWADAIIHLAGAGIADERWTEKRKSEIINSRVNSIALLRNTMISQPHSVQ